MNGAIDILLDEQVIDGLHILILSGISGPNDGADTDRVLVDETDRLFRVDDPASLGAINISILSGESLF